MRPIEETLEYATSKALLSGQFSKRTKVDYFEHIREGVKILKIIEPAKTPETLAIQQAFCLHPLIQSDEEFQRNYRLLQSFRQEVVILTMEYRWVANQGIRSIVKNNGWTVKLSCLESVNKMLVSDKIQNRKLFLSNYPKENEDYSDIDTYFKVWLNALGITENEYQRIVSMI
jgi:hypothetical protein